MKQTAVTTITPNTTNNTKETNYFAWHLALIWLLPLLLVNKPIKSCGSILWMMIGTLFTANNQKKIDPLTRIQEEIKEVVRREQEYRQLTTNISQNETANEHEIEPETDVRAVVAKINNNQIPDVHSPLSILSVQDVSLSTTPSLSPSIASKDESLDDTHHSDDSGISASSSPINGTSAYAKVNNESNKIKTETPRYIGPNCYNLTPKTPLEKTMTRTVSTPHLAAKPRPINIGPAQKGVMQRFIASRGKLQLNKQGLGTINGSTGAASMPITPTAISPLSAANVNSFLSLTSSERQSTNVTVTPPIIERDAEGRPIRRGYVPVEVKIQRELKDLKTRESELKKIRKIRQSTPDLLNSIDNENIETDEDEDVEHCYGPGQLRSAKSISELCDSAQSNNSSSPRATPSPDFDQKYRNSGGMRPAVSLAQLCDLDPKEAPSCHRLIAKFESLKQEA